MATLPELAATLEELLAIQNQFFPTPPISTSISMDDSSPCNEPIANATITSKLNKTTAATATAVATKTTESSSIKHHSAFSSRVRSSPNKPNNTSLLQSQISRDTKQSATATISNQTISQQQQIARDTKQPETSTRSDKTISQQQEQQQNKKSFFTLDIFKQTSIYDALCPIIHELNEQKVVPHENMFLVCNDLLEEYKTNATFPGKINILIQRLEIKEEHIVHGLQQLKP